MIQPTSKIAKKEKEVSVMADEMTAEQAAEKIVRETFGPVYMSLAKDGLIAKSRLGHGTTGGNIWKLKGD